MLVMGLASVIIGLTFFSNHSVTIQAVGVVLGSLLYRIIIQIAYKIDMPSYAVKLLSAVIVVIALVKRKGADVNEQSVKTYRYHKKV